MDCEAPEADDDDGAGFLPSLSHIHKQSFFKPWNSPFFFFFLQEMRINALPAI